MSEELMSYGKISLTINYHVRIPVLLIGKEISGLDNGTIC